MIIGVGNVHCTWMHEMGIGFFRILDGQPAHR